VEVGVRRRKDRSPRLYFGAAVALAAAAAVMFHGYLGSVRTADALAGPRLAVVVAADPIPRGAVLAKSQLGVARLPVAYAPPGAVTDIEKASGRVVLAALAPGEVVTETRLARVRAGPVASLVPRGLRAFAVPTSLPRGAVVAGDHIDVLATYASAQPHSEVVLEGAEVLLVLAPSGSHASEGRLGPDAQVAGAGAATTLILLVSPGQEERLAFARGFASLEVAIQPAG
jgi:Flp pilus assembly protein CpaB